jgi:hypothetical protein
LTPNPNPNPNPKVNERPSVTRGQTKHADTRTNPDQRYGGGAGGRIPGAETIAKHGLFLLQRLFRLFLLFLLQRLFLLFRLFLLQRLFRLFLLQRLFRLPRLLPLLPLLPLFRLLLYDSEHAVY